MTIDKFSKLNHFNPEINFGPIIVLSKKALQVIIYTINAE